MRWCKISDNFEEVSEEAPPKEESPVEELPEEDSAISYAEEELIIICDDVMIKVLDLSLSVGFYLCMHVYNIIEDV